MGLGELINREPNVWDENPDILKKSVVNLKNIKINNSQTHCNYCNNPNDKENHFFMWGFYSTKMRTDDYEEMLDYGYQRSGNYFYKPDIEKSCCPLYTPRLDITEFKISKAQK